MSSCWIEEKIGSEYKGMKVPDVLLSGNFPEIEKWREEQAIQRTEKLRPDLLNN